MRLGITTRTGLNCECDSDALCVCLCSCASNPPANIVIVKASIFWVAFMLLHKGSTFLGQRSDVCHGSDLRTARSGGSIHRSSLAVLVSNHIRMFDINGRRRCQWVFRTGRTCSAGFDRGF